MSRMRSTRSPTSFRREIPDLTGVSIGRRDRRGAILSLSSAIYRAQDQDFFPLAPCSTIYSPSDSVPAI